MATSEGLNVKISHTDGSETRRWRLEPTDITYASVLGRVADLFGAHMVNCKLLYKDDEFRGTI